jgi:hypothetical protein
MESSKERPKATLDHAPDTTGRNGAIDFVAKLEAFDPSEAEVSDSTRRFTYVMGTAVVALWADLPQEIREKLFDRALVLGHHSEGDEMLREQLATFLHGDHKGTVR